MPKVRPHSIEKNEKYQIIGNFFEIVANLKAKKEVIDFFLGLFTPSEALMMARRIQIAQMLLEEESYEDIRKKLKVGNQTITKTDQWLHNGDEKYAAWLRNCLERKIKREELKEYRTNMLDKYAHHRFLKNLFD